MNKSDVLPSAVMLAAFANLGAGSKEPTKHPLPDWGQQTKIAKAAGKRAWRQMKRLAIRDGAGK